MFTFGYDSYMKYAFPLDELDPIHCTGRGPDYENPENININDVLGDYSLGTFGFFDTIVLTNLSNARYCTPYICYYPKHSNTSQ
jgi:mannosidase alpha-like ER degradation enhancer 1